MSEGRPLFAIGSTKPFAKARDIEAGLLARDTVLELCNHAAHGAFEADAHVSRALGNS